MIINTGQRTDIPAFYAKWFMNRIREGYVMVRNPYYPKLVTRFNLTPDVVDVIGFCTKNPRPMFKYLDELKAYITITGFDSDLEPNVASIKQVIEDFKYLSSKVGKNAIGFRYTPIIINDKYTLDYHIETFASITEKLEGYTTLAVFGFLDLYDKLKKNKPFLKDCDDSDKIKIAIAFKQIATLHNMELRLCSKEKWLKTYGIDVDGCMRLSDYEKAIGKKLLVKQKMQARKGYCACYLSNDIGSYNSCLHLCEYCYANANKSLVMKNYQNHFDDSPLLIGTLEKDDEIRVAKQESYLY